MGCNRLRNRGSRVLVLLLLLSVGANARAAPLTCPDADIWGSSLISGICWSCIFPITLFGTVELDMGPIGGRVPDGANRRALCTCHDRAGLPKIGVSAGAWMPARLVEIVRQPYCMPTMGGLVMRNTIEGWGGAKGDNHKTKNKDSENHFYQYHYWAFPLMTMVDMLSATHCLSGGYTTLDLMYFSEIDPTWNEAELAFFTAPETAVFANPLLQAACAADCVASSANAPIERMYWCAGCWGGVYPLNGSVPYSASAPQVSSLLTTKSIAALHRRGLARKTYGDDNMCGGSIYPTLPKEQYKMSMIFPVPEASNTIRPLSSGTTTGGSTGGSTGGGSGQGTFTAQDITRLQDLDPSCCHDIGKSTYLWGEWRTIPAVGEDFVYVLWRYTDCCVLN